MVGMEAYGEERRGEEREREKAEGGKGRTTVFVLLGRG